MKYIFILLISALNLINSYKLIETSPDINILEDFNFLSISNESITSDVKNVNLTVESIPFDNISNITYNSSNTSDEKNIGILLGSIFGGILGYTAISLVIYKILERNDLKNKNKKEKDLPIQVNTKNDDVVYIDV